MTDNTWHWWEQAIENPADIGKGLQVTTTPEQGYYRTRFKGQPWEPVAIWKVADKWIALRKGKPVDPSDIWIWACRYPITPEAYEQALTGGGWIDDEPTVIAMMGHNTGGVSDLDILRDQIEAAEQGKDAYAGISNDEQASRAQSLRARMNELAGEADKKREALKRPHYEAGKAIDAEWQPLIKSAKAVANWLREEIGAYETLKLRERQRLEAERQRAEAERQAEMGRGVAPAPAPPPLPPLEDTKVKGNYGRAASISTERVVAAITDQDALYGFLREHPDLRSCLITLAQRAVRAGHNPPGVAIEERAKVS